MMTFPLTACCAMLGINPKTLRLWLNHAQMSLVAHPTDARLKCLTRAQVQQLATLHARPLAPLPSALSPAAPPQAQLAESSPSSAVSSVLSCLEQDLRAQLEKLTLLESKVTTLQGQVAQLALALLQERQGHERQQPELPVSLLPSLEPSPPHLESASKPAAESTLCSAVAPTREWPVHP